MMNKNLPDKWIRKAISAAINDIAVDNILIPCYDYRVTSDVNSDTPQHYIVMTSQTNSVDTSMKCAWNWESSILLDIVTTYPAHGNTGSRLLADDILDAVNNKLTGLVLDQASGLEIITQIPNFPNDIATSTNMEVIFRKFMRIEFYIT